MLSFTGFSTQSRLFSTDRSSTQCSFLCSCKLVTWMTMSKQEPSTQSNQAMHSSMNTLERFLNDANAGRSFVAVVFKDSSALTICKGATSSS